MRHFGDSKIGEGTDHLLEVNLDFLNFDQVEELEEEEVDLREESSQLDFEHGHSRLPQLDHGFDKIGVARFEESRKHFVSKFGQDLGV